MGKRLSGHYEELAQELGYHIIADFQVFGGGQKRRLNHECH